MSQQPDAFDVLREFLSSKMRMAALYQPLMLKLLIQNGGWASTRDIAASFLAQDDSQIDYYAEITKRMPGPVLKRHGLVEREGDGYRLLPDVRGLTSEQRATLMRLCDEAVEDYRGRRGDRIYQHRRSAPGDISGSVRYEVLKRAGFRCELCGVPADEAALEVDHIIPRRHGGSDELTNLQALCWRCNANKGARDSTDFRQVREAMNARQEGCIFCHHEHRPKVAENDLAFAIRDGHPVTPLHTLVIPRRHAATFFDLYEPERRAINLLLDEVRAGILAEDKAVEGFNIGMNSGEVAGQTVMHCHVHLIPRRRGDVEQPRGGVRGVIPGKASY
jgi:diadenosine tetraphosphate (Ap4A) HIT family hydrolase/5-methylcytosine-specific restriction endonuclease McrA